MNSEPIATREPPAILVVEDEVVVAKDLERSLSALGYRVLGRASNAEDAIRKAQERRPDLVLMDINLPGRLDGIAAAGVLRDSMRVPVIFLTAFSDVATLDRAKATGPFGYIVKPFHETMLRSAIEVALNKARAEAEVVGQNEELERKVRERTAELSSELVERRRAQDKTARYVATLEGVLAAMTEGVTVYDVEGRIVIANDAAKALYGFDPVGIHTNALWDRLSVHRPDGRSLDRNERPSPRAIAGERVAGEAVVLVKSDGDERCIEISANPMSVNGERCGAVAVWNDVTERRRAEKALRASESLLRSFYDNVPVMMGVTEITEDDVLHVFDNKFTEQVVGQSAEAMAGKGSMELGRTRAYVDSWLRHYRLAAETKAPVRFVTSFPKGEETRILAATVAPIDGHAGPYPRFCYVIVDITESERAKEAIERLNVELTRRAEELEATNKELEAFAYSVSHDLRAPLRGVEGFSKMLSEDFGDRLDAKGLHYLEVIRSSTTEMAQLIDDLLALSRFGRQPMNVSRVDVEELTRSAYAELAATAGDRKIEIAIDSLPPARADRALLRQVVRNLLANAFKFTRPRAVAHIRVGAARDGRENVYWVCDDGVGFDMRFANKLFGVFQRLHSAREFEGTGVGLAIAQRLVARHGGRVWAEGRVDEGATFYFALESGDQT